MLSKKVYLANILIPILLGALIYILFSPDVIFVVYIKRLFHITKWGFRYGSGFGYVIVEFLRNYVCDMLWIYALFFAVHYFSRESKIPLWGVMLICAGMGLLIECFQAFSVISGTFDVFDILLELIVVIMVTIGIYIMKKEKKV